MNAKQYNNVIDYTVTHEQVAQSGDSLATARAVFGNMGVALPQGDVKAVYDTLKTDDYMGWKSCTMQEAQEAANNGTAAIGISEERIVVLSAADEEQPVAQTASVMTLTENTSAFAMDGMRYYSYAYGGTTVNPLGSVYIRNDNTVYFTGSGKTWHCVNHDLIYGDPSAFDDYYQTLSCYNTYVDYNPDDIASSDYTLKLYTSDEIKLLYIIDPYGVAHYVKKCAGTYGSLNDQIECKDSFFRVLYGRNPKRYSRTIQGNWYQTDSRDWDSVISESETLFGMHPIYDATTVFQLVQMALAIVKVALSIGEMATGTGATAKFIVGTASNVLSLGEAVVKDEMPAYINDQVVMSLFDLDWVKNIISVYNSLQDFADSIPDISDFCCDKLDYCANKANYSVYVQLKNNTFYRVEDLYDLTQN